MDSSGMDGMDMDGMDMGGMDMGDMNMGMHQYFWTGTNISNIFIYGLTISGSLGLGFFCLGLVAVALLLEGLRVFREYLREKIEQRAFHVTKRHPDMLPYLKKHSIRLHALQTALHMIQTVVAYVLMLIVMTFNVWLSIAVIGGATLGYLVFGFLRTPKTFARLACQQQPCGGVGGTATTSGSPSSSANTNRPGTSRSKSPSNSRSKSPSSSRSKSPSNSRSKSPSSSRSKSPSPTSSTPESPVPPQISCIGRDNGAYQKEGDCEMKLKCCTKT